MIKYELKDYTTKDALREGNFIVLGDAENLKKKPVHARAMRRISRSTESKVRAFWGTLGYENNATLDWQGILYASKDGNRAFTGIVRQEIDMIHQAYPELKKSVRIVERFIDFRNVMVPFPEVFLLDEIPQLRLTVMLEKDEGAVVFYQNHRDSNRASYIDYVQPEPTTEHNVDGRDRLSYYFDAIPRFEIEPADDLPGFFRLGKTPNNDPFILKIITFKRPLKLEIRGRSATSQDVIGQAFSEINSAITKYNLHKPHIILRYNRSMHDFYEAGIGEVNPDEKTLLLIHGTFSDTDSSFGALYQGNAGFLHNLTNPDKPGHYQQVIAFEHPTLFLGAEENIQALFECFDALGVESFTDEVDLMGTSQGGLLVQYLANLKQTRLRVGKAVLVASANGVGYLSAGRYVSGFLSILRKLFEKTGKPHLAFVSALAQHSVKVLIDQPGLQIMTPNHEKLNAIINQTPYSSITSYLPVIDAYDRSVISARFRIFEWLKKAAADVVYSGTKLFLDEPNDWVVGTKNQFLVPARYCAISDYHPARFREHTVKALHGACLRNNTVQKQISAFLLQQTFQQPLYESKALFDAHLHVFGRNIISSRIMYMLIGDLLAFNKSVQQASAEQPVQPALIPDGRKAAVHDEQDQDEGSGSAILNVLKYILFYKDCYKVLDVLEDEYYNLNSGVYRYIPLMFDLEMTFRSRYKDDANDSNAGKAESILKEQLEQFVGNVDQLSEKVEKLGDAVFTGSKALNAENIKLLKTLKRIMALLNIGETALANKTKDTYIHQIEELKVLKARYENNIFPFLAVDPRRKDMARYIQENVGPGKPFHGIKIYAPNGYSPTDPRLCDNESGFIDGTCLYQYCIDHNLPVMAHNSNAGFSTFVEKLEVCGHVKLEDGIVFYQEPEEISFKNNMPFKFSDAVHERAIKLNHPDLWRIVMEKHKKLKICFAHFGGEGDDWRTLIAQLMRDFPNVYTDLSCMVKRSRLEAIRKKYFDTEDNIVGKIMYGSDFYLNMLDNIKFRDYYGNFVDVFTQKQIEKMSIEVPMKFLGI